MYITKHRLQSRTYLKIVLLARWS